MIGPAPVGEEGFPLYGPGSLPPVRRRGFARLIDTLLIAVPGLIVMAIAWTHVAADGAVTVDEIPLWALALLRLADFVYHTIAVALTGSTVGKAIMGLRVEDPSGTKPGLSRSALRALLPDLASMVPLLGGAIAIIGYLSAERLPMGQHVYDQAAGTIVVSTR